MSGHIAGRKRKWPWATLSVVFAVTLVGSLAATTGGVRIILAIVSALGLGLCLLGLVLVSISSGRLRRQDEGRRTEGDEAAETEADGQPSGEHASTTARARTYEEVFGSPADLDAEGLPPAPDGEGEPGEERAEEIEPQSPQPAEQLPAEDLTVDDPASAADDRSEDGSQEQDHLQRLREEFRAKAKEAALRVKQREAEPHEAASVVDQER